MLKFQRTGHESSYVSWWLQQQENRKDMFVSIKGCDIHVRKNVFSPDPALTHSTALALNTIPSRSFVHKNVLDIGAGCGILGIYASNNLANSVIIADTEKAALSNASENICHSDNFDRIQLRQSDLFSSIPERFDVILANLPIVDVAWPQIKGGTQNVFARFMKDLPEALEPNGTCWMSFASFGDIENFEELLDTQPLPYEIKSETAFSVNWYAIQLKNKIPNTKNVFAHEKLNAP